MNGGDDGLIALLSAILGAPVITQYMALCDCRMLITDNPGTIAKFRDIIPPDLKCEACGGDLRAYGLHGVYSVDGFDVARMVAIDLGTGEPTVDAS